MNHWRYKLLFCWMLSFAAACSGKEVLEDRGHVAGWDIPSSAVKLVVETDTMLDLLFEEQSVILVRVVYENNTPAGHRPVRFSILGNSQGSSLLFASGETESDGRIINPLKAGAARAAFKVRVETTQNTGEQIFELIDVGVDGIQKGDLKATFSYNGTVPVQRVVARIHEGPFNCNTLNFENLPPAVQTVEVASIRNAALFRRLPENRTYTVTASGLGSTGHEIAAGCGVANPIIGRSVVTIKLPLTLSTPRFKGVYDFSTELALTDVIPSPGDEIVQQIEDYLTNPGRALSSLMIEELARAAGMEPILFETMFTTAWVMYASQLPAGTVDYTIGGAFDYLVFDRLPGWANETMNIGGDITGLLNHLMVGGKLEITGANEDGSIEGKWGWDDFMFRWGFEGCDSANACCGRRVYTGEEMGLQPIAADFTGQVTLHEYAPGERAVNYLQYDLTLDEHRLALEYGNILLFVITEFVLQEITGHNSIPCAVESIIGCEDGGEFVCDGPNIGVCGCDRVGAALGEMAGLGPALGVTACDMGLVAAEMGIARGVNSLDFDGVENGNLTMQVTGLLSDKDRDLRTDDIDADLVGTLYVGDAGQTDFTGKMLAEIERTACGVRAECGTESTCGLVPGVLNECEARQVCVPPAALVAPRDLSARPAFAW